MLKSQPKDALVRDAGTSIPSTQSPPLPKVGIGFGSIIFSKFSHFYAILKFHCVLQLGKLGTFRNFQAVAFESNCLPDLL